MVFRIIEGVFLPLLGTGLGAACVFFLRGELGKNMQSALTGFASGIMVSASFFSLIVPALEQSPDLGAWAFLPASAGFLLGMCFLLVLDRLALHFHLNENGDPNVKGMKKTTKLVLAVTLHNLPEGMAVGIVVAGWLFGHGSITFQSALALSFAIALQNFPEGAIISMPLRAAGVGRLRSFGCGVLSGVVEPVGAFLAIAMAGVFLPAMPYLLTFSAGAMFFVVIEELVPEMSDADNSAFGILSFAFGFVLMMALDVGLG